jgi:hypothetical protein
MKKELILRPIRHHTFQLPVHLPGLRPSLPLVSETATPSCLPLHRPRSIQGLERERQRASGCQRGSHLFVSCRSLNGQTTNRQHYLIPQGSANLHLAEPIRSEEECRVGYQGFRKAQVGRFGG